MGSIVSVFHFNRGLYFTVAYMKNYSYLWAISYDIIFDQLFSGLGK